MPLFETIYFAKRNLILQKTKYATRNSKAYTASTAIISASDNMTAFSDTSFAIK